MIEEKKIKIEKPDIGKYKDLDTDALEKLLNDAIKNEEYEKASLIRDELDKRKK